MSRGASPIRIRRASGDSFGSQEGAAAHRRKLLRLTFVFAAIMSCSLMYVWQHIQTNLVGYRLREVEVSNARLHTEIRRLHNLTAELAAPSRIDALAREQGMTRQSAWDLVLLQQPAVAPPPAPEAPVTFWMVQVDRWERLADRIHRSVGPGEALADAGEGDGTNG